MSGGYFDYKQLEISDIAESIKDLISHNDTLDTWGYARNYTPETLAKFTDAVQTLQMAYVMVQRIDWLVSGDDGEDSFHKRWDEGLKSLAIENVGG
jgi:hypothetical protein